MRFAYVSTSCEGCLEKRENELAGWQTSEVHQCVKVIAALNFGAGFFSTGQGGCCAQSLQCPRHRTPSSTIKKIVWFLTVL